MTTPNRILYICSEITPFTQENAVSLVGRYAPQNAQENGYEIRAFMPKFGCINERRNQLHEVIRLSGMNIVVNEIDRPLTIKVASISNARIQVYFIDNEDYFKRRDVFTDEKGEFCKDNDERAILFARGTLETVKKLRWQPTIVHCVGWMSNLVPLYLKQQFKTDPIFSNCKIIVSLYDEFAKERFSPSFAKKALTNGIKPSDIEILSTPTGTNLAKLAVQYADGVIMGSKDISKEITDYISKRNIPSLSYTEVSEKSAATFTSKYLKFYSKFVKE